MFGKGVDLLREKIRGYFENHFMCSDWEQLALGNVNIPSLGAAEKIYYIAPFIENEVKSAVLSCGNYKSLGPDGGHLFFHQTVLE